MTKRFNLKRNIIKVVILTTGIFAMLSALLIVSYSIQIRRYESILGSITASSDIAVKARSIIDQDLSCYLYEFDSLEDKMDIVTKLEMLQSEVAGLKESTNNKEENNSLRLMSNQIDAFVEKCTAVLEATSFTEKLNAFNNADKTYRMIKSDINSFIIIQIDNRDDVLHDLKKNTSWTFVISITGAIAMLTYSFYFGIKSAVKADQKIQEEIDERHKYENKLKFIANHDDLTRLANRRLFVSKTSTILENTKSGKHLLLFLDLDGLKNVNDTFGHEAGDFVLKTVADRLVRCAQDNEIIARVGGDEFCILKRYSGKTKQITLLCDRIINEISKDIVFEERTYNVTISIGVSIFPDHADSYDALVSAADIAMYQAKAAGKNRYHINKNKRLGLYLSKKQTKMKKDE